MSFNHPRAQALRVWLNENYKPYRREEVSNREFISWLLQAEKNGGVIELPAHHTTSGTIQTFKVDP